jgi:hypothetical protein
MAQDGLELNPASASYLGLHAGTITPSFKSASF